MAETVTLARPYAKAAFRTAAEDTTLAEWSEALSLLAAVVDTDTLSALIDSPSLTSGQKRDELLKVCGDKLNQKQGNFVSVLAENNRLALLKEIVVLFELFRADYEQTLEVSVESAFELTDQQLKSLESGLKTALARDVSVNGTIDESLLGGVFIRAGDTVIDASVRGRLNKLAGLMSA